MSSFRRKNLVEVLYRNKKNRLLKGLTLFFLGASATLLLVRAETIINPSISNAVSYMKQIFVTSDGTSNGTIGVVLNGSGNIWSPLYCDGSGANCKNMGNVVTPAYLDAGNYVTGGQIGSLANVPVWVHRISLSDANSPNNGRNFTIYSSDANLYADNWTSAFNWGNHANAGYAKTAELNIGNWDSAYGWGNHSSAGYAKTTDLTAYTKTVDLNIGNWDTAYTNNHTHSNKTVLDGIIGTRVSSWDNAVTNMHLHSNQSILDTITYTPENSAYKNPDVTLSSSDDYYPTVPAVKTYVDNKVPQNIATTASPTFAALTLNGNIGLNTINMLRQITSQAADMCDVPGSPNYYGTMPICLGCTSSSCTLYSNTSHKTRCRAPYAYYGGNDGNICPGVGGGGYVHTYNATDPVANSSFLMGELSLQGYVRPFGGYRSTDGSAGMTVTLNQIEYTNGNVDVLCQLVFENGLLISTTCQ